LTIREAREVVGRAGANIDTWSGDQWRALPILIGEKVEQLWRDDQIGEMQPLDEVLYWVAEDLTGGPGAEASALGDSLVDSIEGNSTPYDFSDFEVGSLASMSWEEGLAFGDSLLLLDFGTSCKVAALAPVVELRESWVILGVLAPGDDDAVRDAVSAYLSLEYVPDLFRVDHRIDRELVRSALASAFHDEGVWLSVAAIVARDLGEQVEPNSDERRAYLLDRYLDVSMC
jgi:hypothetical protein